MAAPPASGNQPKPMWRGEAVRIWEDLIDTDPDLAEELMFEKLLLDARAEQARRGWKGPGHEVAKYDDAEEEQRRARVFQAWQPQAPGSAPPPVSRAVVLGLRAPPHLASKHGMTPSAPAAGPRRSSSPELVKKSPGA